MTMKRQTGEARGSAPQAGFSLIELMVALVITLIVTGAVYGLMVGGQNAFKVQPELTDRQQNIRTAMDLVMRDASTAGSGMPSFIQTFTRGLNAPAGAPQGPFNDFTDELEILANTSGFDAEPGCGTPGSGNVARLLRGTSNIQPGQAVMVFIADGTWTLRYITGITTNNTGQGVCDAGFPHVELNFNQGAGDPTGLNTPGGVCTPNGFGTVFGQGPGVCIVQSVGFTQVIRYRIRNDASGVPNLERFDSSAFLGGFQTIAAGIEDLQVQYVQATGAISPPTDPNGAPLVTTCLDVSQSPPCTNAVAYDSLITQVRVTLVGRSEAQSIQGMTSAPTGPARLRGSLVSSASPRTALQTSALKSVNIPGQPVLWQ
jgi:prepilin-type N-terminal cleavage/methylation domain-containing protein